MPYVTDDQYCNVDEPREVHVIPSELVMVTLYPTATNKEEPPGVPYATDTAIPYICHRCVRVVHVIPSGLVINTLSYEPSATNKGEPPGVPYVTA